MELVFECDVTDDQELAARYNADLVIASDGLNSRIRTRYAATFQPDIDHRRCRFVWLGTRQRFPAFTFAFVHTTHGWFQAHAYQYDAETSTFIVETPEETWRAAGLETMADSASPVATLSKGCIATSARCASTRARRKSRDSSSAGKC